MIWFEAPFWFEAPSTSPYPIFCYCIYFFELLIPKLRIFVILLLLFTISILFIILQLSLIITVVGGQAEYITTTRILPEINPPYVLLLGYLLTHK